MFQAKLKPPESLSAFRRFPIAYHSVETGPIACAHRFYLLSGFFFGIHLFNDLLGQITRHFIILFKFHGEGTAAAGHGA